MKRFFCCFKKETLIVKTRNPLLDANPLSDKLKRVPDTLAELIYLETMAYTNLNSFNIEANQLSEKAQVQIARGDMYRGMFILRQRRYILEESSKLFQLLDDIKLKKQYLQDFPAEFRAAQKIKL